VRTHVSAAQWEAIGDATRRTLLERLRRRPQAVTELAQGLPVSRPAVSQHLRVLKNAGMVRDHAEGTRRIYSLDPRGFASMRAYLDSFWQDALQAFAARAERRE
jgi:DNA-binding transcriptional ArsR family regulator